MNEIPNWIADKPTIPAVLSVCIAIYSRYLPDYFATIKNPYSIKIDSPPKATRWLTFYFHSSRTIKSFTETLFSNLVDDNMKSSFIEFCSDISQDNDLNAATTKLALGQIRSDIENADEINSSDNNDDDDKLFTPEVIFLLKVIFPCIILYRESHTLLFRKARRGDLNALDKLLRLDKAIIGDRLISEQFHKARFTNQHKFSVLSKALQNGPIFKNTSQKVKISLAGLISVVSEKLGHKFSAPEIKEMYDAIAIDYGTDELIDTDIPDSPETFSKAIQRERSHWLNLLN